MYNIFKNQWIKVLFLLNITVFIYKCTTYSLINNNKKKTESFSIERIIIISLSVVIVGILVIGIVIYRRSKIKWDIYTKKLEASKNEIELHVNDNNAMNGIPNDISSINKDQNESDSEKLYDNYNTKDNDNKNINNNEISKHISDKDYVGKVGETNQGINKQANDEDDGIINVEGKTVTTRLGDV